VQYKIVRCKNPSERYGGSCRPSTPPRCDADSERWRTSSRAAFESSPLPPPPGSGLFSLPRRAAFLLPGRRRAAATGTRATNAAWKRRQGGAGACWNRGPEGSRCGQDAGANCVHRATIPVAKSSSRTLTARAVKSTSLMHRWLRCRRRRSDHWSTPNEKRVSRIRPSANSPHEGVRFQRHHMRWQLAGRGRRIAWQSPSSAGTKRVHGAPPWSVSYRSPLGMDQRALRYAFRRLQTRACHLLHGTIDNLDGATPQARGTSP
jgi:hypothetical protein